MTCCTFVESERQTVPVFYSLFAHICPSFSCHFYSFIPSFFT